jgi:hypothetical protein
MAILHISKQIRALLGSFSAVFLLAFSCNAIAKDDLRLLNIKEALSTNEAKARLDPGVKLYFADQQHPHTEKSLGTWVTNKKYPLLNNKAKVVCESTFIDAVEELQHRALKEGGNAVIGIESYYDKMIRPSVDQYVCSIGYVVVGVALRGTVIKVVESEIK